MEITMEEIEILAGVDEAGRGPLAGPVYAAAVILNPAKMICGLTDSKLLIEKKRLELAEIIQRDCLAFAIARAEVVEIDQLNILQASLLAMQRAVMALSIIPTHAMVDGNQCPKLNCKTTAVIKGDLLIPAISAASILAKVARDAEMVKLDQEYPGYGFAKHKGYPTKEHFAALQKLGVSKIHRLSFAPVQNCLQQITLEES